ncbi:glycosyltransferase [Mycolicibacterium elephantis]
MGAFVDTSAKLIVEVGVRQPPGARSSGIMEQLAQLTRALLQAVALRCHKSFRSSHIVHANSTRAAIIGWFACIGSRRRLVVHLRDAMDADSLGSRKNLKLMSFIVSRAAGVIANSKYTLETAAPYIKPGVPTRIILSPIGIASHNAVRPFTEKVRVIGMLARIQEWKGQELLIRAFADVFRESSIKLEIAGSPAFGQESYLSYLRALASNLGIHGQVRFLGHVDDIWPLLDTWDVCVHASLLSEPLGQNVLQYLAACRPTVAADAGGPREWIKHGETGLLFEPGNLEALSSTLRVMVDDSELRSRISRTLADERPVPTDVDVRRMHKDFFECLYRGSRTIPPARSSTRRTE